MTDKSCLYGRCRLSALGCDTGSFLPAFPCCPNLPASPHHLPPLLILNCVFMYFKSFLEDSVGCTTKYISDLFKYMYGQATWVQHAALCLPTVYLAQVCAAFLHL